MLSVVIVIERLDLGHRHVPYREAWDYQRAVHRRVCDGDDPGRMLLLEHAPVITAGTLTDPSELPAHSAIPIVTTDRGGRATWHGPGQLVGYPIVPVACHRDVVAFVRRLERFLIQVAASFGIRTRTVRGRTGVWAATPAGDAKVAAIGMRISRGVSMHGFALNCNNDLEPFDEFVPCGIRDASVTSLSLLAGRRITPLAAAQAIERIADQRGGIA